jgi:arginase
MRDIHLLGVPMDLGAGRRGVDMGASALRLARLGDTLAQLGHRVRDLGNVEVPVAESVPHGTGSARYGEAIAEVCSTVATRIASLPATAVPLLLGGDHAVSLGSVAGAVRRAPGRRVGILWIDAHADLNTPATSPSGNVHGMPLALLLGHGDEALRRSTGIAPLRPEDVVLLGLRSVDPDERAFIRGEGLTALTMSDVDRGGIAAVTSAALAALAHVDTLHVSFDADVLDPAVAPGVGTPVPGGLGYREAHLLMELLHESGRVSSVDLVEVNPILDEGNRTAGVVVELAASLFGRTIL